VTAGAIGFVAFGFYLGNVYGGINAAAKHDRALQQDVVGRTRSWLDRSRLWFGLTPEKDGGAPGIALGFWGGRDRRAASLSRVAPRGLPKRLARGVAQRGRLAVGGRDRERRLRVLERLRRAAAHVARPAAMDQRHRVTRAQRDEAVERAARVVESAEARV